MKKLLVLMLSIFVLNVFAQSEHKTKNIILITLDGYRWQELFTGADSALVFNKEYTANTFNTVTRFWGATENERRQKLMPFMWQTLAQQGQLYGNRRLNNKVNATNPHWVSYPGYCEILCGYVDTLIGGNKKRNNPNITVLEFLNNIEEFKGKVAVFSSWDVFPYIVNANRSKIPVNTGFSRAENEQGSANIKLLNTMQNQVPELFGGVRFDVFTHYLAMEYMKKHNPRVIFIGYGEPDEWAHKGKYENYLQSANYIDQFIADIWNFVQTNPFYKDKTTLLITTDHGRGDAKKGKWKSHGFDIVGAGDVWLAAIGPDTKPLGEIKTEGQLYLTQIAQTIANLLGLEYSNHKPLGGAVISIIH
ncbi:phosphoglyceromutase [Solitalea lacus]|uniref:phosphoglyceromutase n=1 Tax=Solitalea lacus TaxID=2911172 RepID=UPI001EDB2F81|nr:phosphoglyceromutase [Solitalea lacus]UKJ06665.1 phosphoglyceromutase [Solitalea lacus]